MERFVIEIMNKFGYLGTFFLIMIENVFPPIPSEVILTFSGYMTTISSMTVLGVIFFSTLGSVVGAIILYYIGYLLNKDTLIKIVKSKYGKLLRIKAKDIESADKWFLDKGNITVLLCRFVPVVRSLISIPAGMSKMEMIKFLFYTLIGSLVWNSVLVWVGAYAGDKKDYILGIIDNVSYVVVFMLGILVVIFGVWYYKNKIKKKSIFK